MESTGDGTSRDRWGEPCSVQPSAVGRVARPGRRRWPLLAIGAIVSVVAAVGVYVWAIKPAVIRSLSESCREALQANDLERLEGLTARWQAWDPHKAAPLIYLAEAANQAKQYDRAAELLDRLPDGDRMTPAALLERSSMLFDPLNRPIDAVETLERAVRLEPRLVEARRRLVYYYAMTLQPRKMAHHAYEAIRHDCDLPETYVYLMLKDWLSFANACSETAKWCRGNPDEETLLVARALQCLVSKAEGFIEVSEPKMGGGAEGDAVAEMRKLVAGCFQRFPRNIELLAHHLKESSTNGDAAEVARLLSQAPPEAADDGRFWRYQGWLHAARGELTAAEDAYGKALELNCYDYVGRHQLAGVKRRLKKFDEVKPLEDLVTQGKALLREIHSLKSVDKVSRETMARMADHARGCGDYRVAQRLTERLRSGLAPAEAPSEPPK